MTLLHYQHSYNCYKVSSPKLRLLQLMHLVLLYLIQSHKTQINSHATAVIKNRIEYIYLYNVYVPSDTVLANHYEEIG